MALDITTATINANAKQPKDGGGRMFVYEPNLVIYCNLLQTIQVTRPTSFAEQDFLNIYFKDKYKPIPNMYNLVLAMLWHHPENVELDKVQVL
ncbi:Galactinol synthase 2 [Spatholobus suberectus]|nr:Galactinol synthase 2 [Spatholobus suberectus]